MHIGPMRKVWGDTELEANCSPSLASNSVSPQTLCTGSYESLRRVRLAEKYRSAFQSYHGAAAALLACGAWGALK